MKISKKAIVITGIVLVAAVGIGMSARAAMSNQAAAMMGVEVRTISLEKTDLSSTVNSTGIVYSANAVNVYSSLNYSIKAVNAQVGDYVEAGDVLLELDSTDLEASIAQSRASLGIKQASAYQSLTSAQKDLETRQQNLQTDRDNALLRAEQAVDSAKDAVASAKLEVESANVSLSVATRNFREAYDKDSTLNATDNEIRNLRSNMTQAEISLQRAENRYSQSLAELENTKVSLEIAKKESTESTRALQERVASAQLSSNHQADIISLENLERNLADCLLVAPVSGTITAVNAKEGASGSGLMFVIQNTDELKVITNVKEYDITTVSVGDKVIVKTDPTGDEEFLGQLSRIAPTTTLTAGGGKANSTDAEFEAEIDITSKNSPLRIGMNARVNIVTEEKSGVFAVPFEALDYIDGESYVYVQEPGDEGTFTYRKLLVESGLETNIYVEIWGDELIEGMQIVRSISDIPLQLMPQDIPPQEVNAQ